MEYEYFKTVHLIMKRVFFSSNKMKNPFYDLIDYHILKNKFSMKTKVRNQLMIISLPTILICSLHSNYH